MGGWEKTVTAEWERVLVNALWVKFMSDKYESVKEPKTPEELLEPISKLLAAVDPL